MSSSVNLFLENQKIKQENDDLKKTLCNISSMFESKLTSIISILNEIKDKQNLVSVNLQSSENLIPVQKEKENEKQNYFIPDIDVSKIDVKTTDIHKRSRKIDITDSVQKLQKLDNF